MDNIRRRPASALSGNGRSSPESEAPHSERKRAAQQRVASHVPALPPEAGIAVIRLRSLGDTLLTTPALHALKVWRPDLRIAVAVEPRYSGVLAGNPDIAEIIEVPAGAAGRLRAVRALRHFKPALAVGLHGGSTAAFLARASGAPRRATFLGLRHGWAYNLHTPPKAPPPGRARLHTVEHVASLFEALGMPPTTLGPLQLFPSERARQRARQRLAQRGVTGPYAFLSTEARESGLRWPLPNFRDLAAWLRRERGLASVMASAAAGEPVAGATLISGTTVEELIALEAESELVVGNDGGPIHIAAALGKPVVALYSTTDIEVWSPWQARARCLQANPLAALAPDAVVAVLSSLLIARP